MQKSDKKVVSLFEKTNPGFQKIALTDSLRLKRGGYLKNPFLAYETWGELSKEKDNIIVILTGLSASSHVASSVTNSETGWWEGMVGKGKAFDTNKYYVVCINAHTAQHGASLLLFAFFCLLLLYVQSTKDATSPFPSFA